VEWELAVETVAGVCCRRRLVVVVGSIHHPKKLGGVVVKDVPNLMGALHRLLQRDAGRNLGVARRERPLRWKNLLRRRRRAKTLWVNG
jgi:hypothetical protein